MFEIFPEGGHWCARRSDGLVCGLFRDRAAAERFARLEDETPSVGPAPVTTQPVDAAAPQGKTQL